jgi:mono/diheme cytochrome c family protein
MFCAIAALNENSGNDADQRTAMKNARTLLTQSAFALVLCLFFNLHQPVRADGAVSGADVYKSHCAACHDQGLNQAPPKDALQKMSAARILKTMDFGLMMGIAYPLTRDERDAVAKFLGTAKDDAALPAAAFCSAAMPVMPDKSSPGWNGWSPSVDNTRFQTADQAGLTAANIGSLKLKWAFGFPGDVTALAAPTILKGLFLWAAPVAPSRRST